MANKTFLVEIGTEELPPKALKKLAEAFAGAIEHGLQANLLPYDSICWYASPRRLAARISKLEARAPDRNIEAFGPPADRAREGDAWSKAASGFARKHGVTPEELEVTETEKGLRLVFRSTAAGVEATTCLPEIIAAAVAGLPIPKRMRWGASRTEFVRPVHWVVMLYGDSVVDCSILGIKAGRATRGHRFHCDRALPLAAADDYVSDLRAGKVLVDFNERRETILEQVVTQGTMAGGQAVIDPDLLDEVTSLNEWPVALMGNFEERFLEVPPEALISSMKEHQKYFHVVDDNGALLPSFITVANIESTDPQQVIEGNERVIRPRLSDAAFFYNNDLRTPLGNRLEQLKSVVFQQQLGSLFDKAERISSLAAELAPTLGADPILAARAGLLAKADLVSDMVFEFGDLQGIAGFYYARHDGEHEDVARAMIDQYLPRFAGDDLPQCTVGSAVALADRFDTLAGIFGIGQAPTGSKDPFALRRASMGVLRIIIEGGVNLDLRNYAKFAVSSYSQVTLGENTADVVVKYILERMRSRYQEQGLAAEIYMSVEALDLSQPYDIDQRVQAVHSFAKLDEAAALASANKRVANILDKEGVLAKSDAVSLDRGLLTAGAEEDLAEAVSAMQEAVRPLLTNKDYQRVLTTLSSLQKPVDQFFDQVMVMVDDKALRSNRLALLSQLRNLFLEVADISLLVPTK
ncbi:MAG: glycyl-tRNA synthetase beta chain [Halieaceae bacterium]|jgi:glycyl-tRNA synthetase beta chain